MNPFDSHVHVWGHGVMHPFQRGPIPIRATVADLREVTTGGEVAGVLIVPSSADLVNGRALEAAAAMGNGSGAVALIRRAADPDAHLDLAGAGYRGLRLNLKDAATAEDLKSGSFTAALKRASRSGLPLSLQLGTGQAAMVKETARRHPDLAVVIDHLGSPWTPVWGPDQDALVDLLASPNVVLKVSALESWSDGAFPFVDCWPLVRRLCEAAELDRLVWASNWPLSTEVCGYADLQTLPVQILGLTETEAGAVLGGNARRLYQL